MEIDTFYRRTCSFTTRLSYGRFEDELSIPSIAEYACGEVFFTSLNNCSFIVFGVEHLLSSLEACGVSNCRIEIEGGREVPVLDGSSSGWVSQVSRVGVVFNRCVINSGYSGVHRPFCYYSNTGSFISVVPSVELSVTAGWNGTGRGASCFGKGWSTLQLRRTSEFVSQFCAAKSFFHSSVELDCLYDLGLVQAGPTLCSVVALGYVLEDPGEVTYGEVETSRHKLTDFIGDLALLCRNGYILVVGHFVS